MKDLFVLTADADALAVMRQVLSRHYSLGIREITYEVDRHTGRDAGMIHTGPALVQFKKGEFKHVLLLWDHQGSGKECMNLNTVQNNMTSQLDGFTWKDNNLVIAVMPELEEWLWHNPEALLKHLDITENELNVWLTEFAKKAGNDIDSLRRAQPKEMFEHLVYKKKQGKPGPDDFDKIASIASLTQWQQSASFRAIVEGLRQWFPIP
ncbi:MAG: hypothetical protein HQL87_05515 [Magnetococcales bacterium]|nr:hypothetical protein [Magnetococcales bacterium]